jgi:hypothetical protein
MGAGGQRAAADRDGEAQGDVPAGLGNREAETVHQDGWGHLHHRDGGFDKTGFFWSFPYVCPEPVLVKTSFYI